MYILVREKCLALKENCKKEQSCGAPTKRLPGVVVRHPIPLRNGNRDITLLSSGQTYVGCVAEHTPWEIGRNQLLLCIALKI